VPDILRQIGIVASSVGSIFQIWGQERLFLHSKLLSLHEVVDPLDLVYWSFGGFPYALSKTDSSCEVAGYG